jgi:hypothetical protein
MQNPMSFEECPKLREPSWENLEGALKQSVVTPHPEAEEKKLVISVWQLNLEFGASST